MNWLRYLRLFIPVFLQAVEVAGRLSENRQYQRRFLKAWVEESIPLLEAVLVEVEDRLDDTEDPLTLEG